MAGEWQELSLREAGVQLLDCDHKTPVAVMDGYPYIAIPQLKSGRIDPTDARRISNEDYVTWTRRTKPQAWDVVVSRRCNPGETAFVPPDFEFALGQNLIILRSVEQRVYPPFMRWLLRSPAWWEQVQTFINVGAVFESLKCADIPNFRLPIPPLREQQAIACILGALDDKIELNRRMNRTLELIARTIFKSWFVDFDPVRAKAAGQSPPGLAPQLAALFPDAFENSELGEIPYGWHVRMLEQLSEKIGSGATPRGGEKVYVDNGIALVRSQNVYDSDFRWDGLARITPEAAAELNGVTLEPDDVLINITGASILRTCVVDPSVLPARVNQHVARIRPKPDVPARFLHLHLMRPETKDHLMGMNAGATREAITKSHLQTTRLVVPQIPLLEIFKRTVQPAYECIQNRLHQSRILAAMRDTLLPKLISGELRVPDAERIVGRAV